MSFSTALHNSYQRARILSISHSWELAAKVETKQKQPFIEQFFY